MTLTNLEKEIDAKTVKEHVERLLQKWKLNSDKIDIASETLVGDNYLGLIARVHIEAENDGKERKILNLIVKSATINEGFRNAIKLDEIFGREILVYEKVLPALDELQKERGVLEPFTSYPPCYYTCRESYKEALVFENMKEKGFRLADRKKTLDYEHVLLVLRQYAKYHALSFALKDQKPELFQELKGQMGQLFFEILPDEELRKFMDIHSKDVYKALAPVEDKTVIKKYETFHNNSLAICKEIFASSENGVFTHGDCWVNNMLFKYDDLAKPQHPTDICFLDFQISSVSSPVIDLSYFLLVNAEDDLRKEHYEELMEEYHSTLSSFLRELGSDPEKMFPWDVFQKELKKCMIFGLLCAINVLKIMVSDADEAPAIDECENYDEFIQMFGFATRNGGEYYRRLRDAVLFLVRSGYI